MSHSVMLNETKGARFPSAVALSYAGPPILIPVENQMPSGGPRRNAGRPKGPNGRKHRAMEIAADAAAKGVTPIEVMLDNMRYHHRCAQAYSQAEKSLVAELQATGADAGEIADATKALRAAMLGARKDAQESAKDAAPYIHPRLQSVELGGNEEKPLVVEIVRFSDSSPVAEPVAAALVPDANLERAGEGVQAGGAGRAPTVGER